MRHETAIFGPKKPKSRNSNYHLFLPVFFSFNNKEHKKSLKPLFESVLANLKKENFQNLNLKHWKKKKKKIAPFFEKGYF